MWPLWDMQITCANAFILYCNRGIEWTRFTEDDPKPFLRSIVWRRRDYKRIQKTKQKNNCLALWERNTLSFWNIKFISMRPLTNMRTSEMLWETKLDDVFVNSWRSQPAMSVGMSGEDNSVWTASFFRHPQVFSEHGMGLDDFYLYV